MSGQLSWRSMKFKVGLMFFFSLFLFFPLHLDCHPRSEPMSFFQGIRLVMGHGPYAKLVMVFLFTSLAFMVRFPETSPFSCLCSSC